MTDLSSLFDKLREECREEGREEAERRKEAEALRQQQQAILRLLERKGFTRSSYQSDVERFERISDATDFLVDFAAASDPSAFLKEKFGH